MILERFFLWDGQQREILEFIAKCTNCTQVKDEHQKSSVLLQEIQIPTYKCKDINIYFIIGFLLATKQYDYILVVPHRLTKSAHFILTKCTYSA